MVDPPPAAQPNAPATTIVEPILTRPMARLLVVSLGALGFAWVSTLWNLAYDAGMGIGAVGFGLLVAPIGYSAGFALTAAVLLTVLVPAWRERRRFPARLA